MKSCRESDLAVLSTCADSIDGLVSGDGTGGCIVAAVRNGVQSLLNATRGQ